MEMDHPATHFTSHGDLATASESAKPEGVVVVYDGQCPFCSTYVRYTRLREAVGPVQLVDARSGGPVVEEAVRAGLDLDEGMALKYGGRLYHGADCLNMLSLLSSRSGLFNRLMAFTFARPGVAHMAYPMLRAGRNATLKLLGRGQFHQGR
jgi:predicted DCC family thiol-disulfide oxidoreductase YuxK